MGGGVAIAVIADIARHRRDRKGRTLPLINRDDTDRRNQEPFTAKNAEDAKKSGPWMGQASAKLGSLGTTRYKSFGFLVEGWGVG